MNTFRRLALLCLFGLPAVWYAAPSAAQMATNYLVMVQNFGMQSNSLREVDLQGEYWYASPQTLFVNPVQKITAYDYPQITNGGVVFSNMLSGVPYKLTIQWQGRWGGGFYSTNFMAPTNAAGPGGAVNVAQWVGQYVSPTNFMYPFPSSNSFTLGYPVSGTNGSALVFVIGLDAAGNAATNVFTGGGGGSATNVFFISGTNTYWTQINGSNQFNFTGPLTSNQISSVNAGQVYDGQKGSTATNSFDASGSALASTNTLAATIATQINLTNTLNLTTTTGLVVNAVASNTNFWANLYNDTNALAFCNSLGIADQNARDDLVSGVRALKQYGVWPAINDVVILPSRYIPTAHLSLLLNPFSVTNEQYTKAGFVCYFTNQLLLPLVKSVGTNFTLFVAVQQSADGLDAYDNTANMLNNLAELVASDGSSALLTSWGVYRGARVYTSTKGTYWASNNVYCTTNIIASMGSGEFRTDGAVASTLPTVYCLSGNTNGTLTVWVNGNQAALNSPANPTNAITESAITSALNKLLLGGGDQNWNAMNPYVVSGFTNAYGVTIIAAGALSTNCTQSIATGIYRFCTDIMDYDNAVEFDGSSILNNQQSVNGGTPGTPFTNSLPYVYSQMHTRTLVIQDASPGSTLVEWTNMTQGWSNGIVFQPSITLLDGSRYRSRSMKSDGPRNDSTSVAAASSAGLWRQLFLPWRTNGINAELLVTPWFYSGSQAANLNWIATAYAISTNYPLLAMRPLNQLWTSNFLALASQDSPPVHPDAVSIFGHMANVMMAAACDGNSVPLGQIQQYFTVGVGAMPDAYTNLGMTNLPFVVTDPYGKQYNTLDASGLTNLPATGVTTNSSPGATTGMFLAFNGTSAQWSNAPAGGGSTANTVQTNAGGAITIPLTNSGYANFAGPTTNWGALTVKGSITATSGTNVTQTVTAQTVSNLLVSSYAVAGPPTTPSTINFVGGSYLTEPESGISQTLTAFGNSGLILNGNGKGVSFTDQITGATTNAGSANFAGPVTNWGNELIQGNLTANGTQTIISNNSLTAVSILASNAIYAEVNIQNLSSAGSSDSTQTADNGNGVTNYFNQGINGSRYIPATGVVGNTNDTYLISVGGNSYWDLVGGSRNWYWTWQASTNSAVQTNMTLSANSTLSVSNITLLNGITGNGAGLTNLPATSVTTNNSPGAATGMFLAFNGTSAQWSNAPAGGGSLPLNLVTNNGTSVITNLPGFSLGEPGPGQWWAVTNILGGFQLTNQFGTAFSLSTNATLTDAGPTNQFSWSPSTGLFVITNTAGTYHDSFAINMGSTGTGSGLPSLQWYRASDGLPVFSVNSGGAVSFVQLLSSSSGSFLNFTASSINTPNNFLANFIAVTNGIATGQQPTASSFAWSKVPQFSSTVTNAWIGNGTNGTIVGIYSNTSSSYDVVQLVPNPILSGGVLNGNGAGVTNHTTYANLGPDSVPGSNTVAAMIVALAGAGSTTANTVQTNASGVVTINNLIATNIISPTGGTFTGSGVGLTNVNVNVLNQSVLGAQAANQSNIWFVLNQWTNSANLDFVVSAATNINITGISNTMTGFPFAVTIQQASTVTTNLVTIATNATSQFRLQVFGQFLTMPTNSTASRMTLYFRSSGTNSADLVGQVLFQ